MLRVGVTGGIGSGKTALTDWLATQGVTIVDADLAARSVVRPGQPALLEIADEFGEDIWIRKENSIGLPCAPRLRR